MADFPAELVGGPQDGEHVQSQMPLWKVSEKLRLEKGGHYNVFDPLPKRIGLYEARKVSGEYVRRDGWYLFDWKGWG